MFKFLAVCCATAFVCFVVLLKVPTSSHVAFVAPYVAFPVSYLFLVGTAAFLVFHRAVSSK